jgi:predicted Rossmann fold nucleotide-binding protein DprA/Smf involved in DNA uptake
VLGSGLDRLYPEENAGLASQIAEHGAVVSELALGSTHPRLRVQPDA